MARVNLISSAKLRAFTDIGNNYNATDLSNAVEKAQKLELEPIIGKNLYEGLQDGVVNETLTADETTLLNDYIEDFLIQASYLNVLESIFLRPRSSGLGQRAGSEGFTPASRELYNQKRLSVQAEMDFYGNKLVEYLDANLSLFPELLASTDLSSDEPNLDNQHNSSPLIINRNKNNKYGW